MLRPNLRFASRCHESAARNRCLCSCYLCRNRYQKTGLPGNHRLLIRIQKLTAKSSRDLRCPMSVMNYIILVGTPAAVVTATTRKAAGLSCYLASPRDEFILSTRRIPVLQKCTRLSKAKRSPKKQISGSTHGPLSGRRQHHDFHVGRCKG